MDKEKGLAAIKTMDALAAYLVQIEAAYNLLPAMRDALVQVISADESWLHDMDPLIEKANTVLSMGELQHD